VCIVVLLGTHMFAYIVGSVASHVSNEAMSARIIREKAEGLREYMMFRDMPLEMQKRIRNHYEYSWQQESIFDEQSILAGLPPFLRKDVLAHLHSDLMKLVPFLANLEPDAVSTIVSRLNPLLVSPFQDVLRKVERCTELYIIDQGEVQL
jgi:hypothetical protein